MPRAAACLAAGVSLAALFAVPHSSMAQAQESPASVDDGAHLEEIVVTARRRSEKLETVPISVTLFSADDLREHAIETIADLQRLVPTMVALNVTNRDSDQLSIRGLPGVVAYFAEAPVVSALAAAESGSGSGSGASLYYDLQRVEVLKGPQSTLFGGTTTGGAILFEPRRPTKDFEGYGELTLGDYNNRMVEAAVNVPIVADKLMVRVAGQTQMRDGFTENIVTHKDLDNKDYYAARIGVTLRPSDDFDNYFVYSSYYSDTNGTGEHLNAVNPDGFALLAYGPALSKALALETALGPWKTALDVPEIGKEYTFGFNDIAQYFATDELTVRNIAAYTESKYLFRWDLDGSPLPIVGSTSPTNWSDDLGAYSEELQVQGSPLNGAIEWTAGMFLQFVHPVGYSYVQSIEFETPVNTVIKNPLTAAGRTTTREQAIYGQLTYDLGDLAPAISGLKFTGGYRYTWDYASNVQNDYNGLGQCESDTLISVPHCYSEVSGYFRQGTWTAGLDSGGFNSYAPSPNLRSYQPEHLTDFEVGAKSKWTLWGMPWRATANGFYDRFSNIQRNVAVVGGPNSGNPGISTITENAAEATLEGLEFEGKLVPIKSIELSASYAYANSRYDKYLSPTAGDLSGLPFTGGPRNQYSATGRYYLPVADRLGRMSLSATYSWQGHIQFSDREVGGIIPPHGLLDVRADWNDIAGRPVDLAFFMTNATDQVYIAGGTVVYNALGVNPVIYGEPRMWGFQLRYRFGPHTGQDF
jgi:iron complex outermembrane receptor protein